MAQNPPDLSQFVPFERKLQRVDIEKQLVATLEAKIRSLPDFLSLRLNPEIVLFACNLVENVVKKKYKVNKKDLCITVLSSIFNFTEADKKSAGEIIEFLHSTSAIKRATLWKKLKIVIKKKLKQVFL
jgi:hypothetical protein